MKVTPSPPWATALPQSARGSRESRESPELPVRSHRSTTAPAKSQAPRPAPITASAECPVETAKTSAATAAAKASAPRRGTSVRFSLPRFHGRIAPRGRTIASATMKGVKAFSKKGAPTDSFLSQAISATSGQTVPMKTTKAATASRMLFSTSAPSRETGAKTPLACIAGARKV